jgi:hypothetical protein
VAEERFLRPGRLGYKNPPRTFAGIRKTVNEAGAAFSVQQPHFYQLKKTVAVFSPAEAGEEKSDRLFCLG